jgi:[acyl-carrier-protein] S-malonyltransferase
MWKNPAMLFPGQGAQYVGMASSLISGFPEIEDLYHKAAEVTGVDLASISSEGPAEELVKTSITQPAIYLHSLALTILLKKQGVEPVAVAGHSLGEYTALAAAGWLDPMDGLALVRERGKLMYQAGLEQPGTMAAVIGAKAEVVAECCQQASDEGEIVQAANFNCPGQIAISGSTAGIARATELLKEKRVRLVKRLVVSGAFHSPLLESARQGLLEKLDTIELHQGRAPLYCNVSGERVDDIGKIREFLGRQLTETVQWESCITNMLADGYNNYLELGPGKVLSGLLKRINKEALSRNIDTAEDLLQFP